MFRSPGITISDEFLGAVEKRILALDQHLQREVVGEDAGGLFGGVELDGVGETVHLGDRLVFVGPGEEPGEPRHHEGRQKGHDRDRDDHLEKAEAASGEWRVESGEWGGRGESGEWKVESGGGGAWLV